MFDLTGKSALVTGASGGIGGGIAQALAAAGAKVALSGTREEKLASVAAAIAGETVIVPANLSDAGAVDGLIKAAEDALGTGVDILVNNAGITKDTLALRMKAEDWQTGMIGFSKSLAQEVANRGVTVNCVAPGFIASAMTGVLTDEQKSMIATRIPAGSIGKPEDIAAAVVYLASNEAGYVTGQTLHVNGGMAMI